MWDGRLGMSKGYVACRPGGPLVSSLVGGGSALLRFELVSGLGLKNASRVRLGMAEAFLEVW